ncbi:endonuclease MutS2 [Spirochaetia bacterium]|nr:endonuclease MutS2 [Spirochaetia bacterium]
MEKKIQIIDIHSARAGVFTLLEYNKILEQLASFAKSEEVADILKEQTPLTDSDQVDKLKAKVAALVKLMHESKDEPQAILPSVKEVFSKLKVEGAVITISEAFALGNFLKTGLAVVKWIENKDFSLLPIDFSAGVSVGEKALLEITKVIDSSGKIRETAEIRAIRGRIAAINRDLQSITTSFTHGDQANMLQSVLPTQRDGRIVLAVRANFKGKINGIVHDVSSGGGTVFIEPQQIVEKNNDLVIEERLLDEEIRRIMRVLSENLHLYTLINANTQYMGDNSTLQSAVLSDFYNMIIEIELLRARAHFSMPSNLHFAKDSDFINLIHACHPLLGPSCVPIDLCMRDLNMVLISGPNSGGKTIALKTTGLLCLMNQNGMAIPCAEESSLPVFRHILADIGDEQSIESELSTFSAHISNVSRIIDTVRAAVDVAAPHTPSLIPHTPYPTPQNPPIDVSTLDRAGGSGRPVLRAVARGAVPPTKTALILFDELCSGTDPAEGSALSMAILDELQAMGAILLVSTHHGALKNYVWGKSGAQNASVAFDSETLRPCYKIVMGVPGESRALDIASRYGLGDGIIRRARAALDVGSADISALIASLSEKMRAANERELELNEKEAEFRERQHRIDLYDLRLRQKEAEIKAGSMGTLRNLLSESRKTLENLVRELKERDNSAIGREQTMKVKEFLSVLEQTVEIEEGKTDAFIADTKQLKKAHDAGENGKAAAEFVVKEGMNVLVGDNRRHGIVKRAGKKSSDGKLTWIVDIGSISATFKECDIYAADITDMSNNKANSKIGAHFSIEYANSSAPVLQLKLLGMRCEEALAALQKQLDSAVINGLHEFSVIHGKGDGILQTAVHEFLRNQSCVADYYFSRPELGGAGRTEVVLK